MFIKRLSFYKEIYDSVKGERLQSKLKKFEIIKKINNENGCLSETNSNVNIVGQESESF